MAAQLRLRITLPIGFGSRMSKLSPFFSNELVPAKTTTVAAV
jgi:hypothetical protein